MTAAWRQNGFTLLVLLFLIAGFGAAMAALGTFWQTYVQREKEAELLFIGDQYRRAIESYHLMSPGAEKKYPPNFAALLQDPRFPTPVRHLRRLYRDPMTAGDKSAGDKWGLIKAADGGIAGIHSLSEKEPRKKTGFSTQYEGFDGKKKYSEWVFETQAPLPQNTEKQQTPVVAGKPKQVGRGE